jgi:hypothetical protein
MSEFNEEDVKMAFEVIKNAFQEKLNSQILSVHSIEFITADSANESEVERSDALRFNLFSNNEGIHDLTSRRCRRIGNRWVCS